MTSWQTICIIINALQHTEETLAKSSWNQLEKKFVENETIFLLLNEHVNCQFQKMRGLKFG